MERFFNVKAGDSGLQQISRNARAIEIALDMVCVVVGLPLATVVLGVIAGYSTPDIGSTRQLLVDVLCLLAWLSALIMSAEYPSKRRSRFRDDLWVVLRANALACLLFGALAYVLKVMDVSRLQIALLGVTISSLMLISRSITRSGVYLLRSSGMDTRSYLVVGDTDAAHRYLAQATAYRRLGIRILGYVAMRRGVLDAAYLGTPRDLDGILSNRSCDGVVIALPLSDPHLQSVLEVCECHGKSVELVLDAFSSRITQSTVYQGPFTMNLVLSSIPHTPAAAFIKRLTDVVVSAMALVMLSPLFLLVTIAIKLDDGGPVIFRQQRVGLHNKYFWMFKFRSMHQGAEALQEQLLQQNEMSGPVFKMTDDPRVTRVGKFMRRTSIDELPQFLNVLRGEMSLVGPRPPLPNEVSKYQAAHRRRLSVKPGLTCLWQVSGRNNIDFEQWMDLDLLYIDNWSYLRDWAIIAKTIPAVLKRTGAR
ncbi:sugar transferase [Alicyclobacillus curvatus]|nr:sugar transferase [Alicyclobacillus curvatus]